MNKTCLYLLFPALGIAVMGMLGMLSARVECWAFMYVGMVLIICASSRIKGKIEFGAGTFTDTSFFKLFPLVWGLFIIIWPWIRS